GGCQTTSRFACRRLGRTGLRECTHSRSESEVIMSTTATETALASGEDIVERAREHVGEKYILGVLAPKDNSNWTGPWDCAEFASWLVFQVAAKLYGCR